jgi:hypothetical protein
LTDPPAVAAPDANTSSRRSTSAPSSSIAELTSDNPIVATLVDDPGLPKTTFDPDIVPEAIRTAIWSDKRVQLVIGMLVVMVIVVVGAVVALLVFGGGEKATEQTVDGFSQDLMPSVAPSLMPTRIGQEVLDVLADASFDRGAALFNVSTPQKLASDWLLDDPNVLAYFQTRLL